MVLAGRTEMFSEPRSLHSIIMEMFPQNRGEFVPSTIQDTRHARPAGLVGTSMCL